MNRSLSLPYSLNPLRKHQRIIYSSIQIFHKSKHLTLNTYNYRIQRFTQPFKPNKTKRYTSTLIKQENEIKSQEDGIIAKPIDFETNSSIQGDESQVVIIDIGPNEVLRGESGNMLYMTEGIEMSTSIGSAGSAFTKFLTGQNLFYSDYRYLGSDGKGQVALGTDFPSKIIRLNVDRQPLVAQKGALLCYSHTVNISMEMVKNLSTGFFGGEGFVLMKLDGAGDVFLKGGGMIIKHALEQGEELRISSGSLVAFTEGMDYDVSMMKGIKNVMFGGEGLFITTLTGPGTVWLQSMPQDRFISSIVSRIPSKGPGIGFGIPIAGGASDTSESTDSIDGSGAVNEVATEEAIQSDRNATIASSGFTDESPDSPSSLFGDAASENTPSNMESTNINESNNEFSDSFDTLDNEFNDFQDDSTTSFSQQNKDDPFFNDETSFSTEEAPSNEPQMDDASQEKGFFSTLWDFFNDDE